jgi:hypothetical protein
VLIGSDASSTVPPPNLTTAKTFLRVFESNTAGDYLKPQPIADLRIGLQTEWAVLNWRQETNASGYRVETLGNLSLTNWQLIAEPAVNTWSNAVLLSETQRFFRVFFKP